VGSIRWKGWMTVKQQLERMRKKTLSRHFFHIYLKELKRNKEIFNLDNPLISKSNTKVPQTQSRSESATLPLSQTMRGN